MLGLKGDEVKAAPLTGTALFIIFPLEARVCPPEVASSMACIWVGRSWRRISAVYVLSRACSLGGP
jgi:hypothetical protein